MSTTSKVPGSAKVSGLEHAMHSAHTWVNEVAREFDTDDREFAYGVLRAWLHTLRDRLTVEAAAHFAAQLPDLIRGVYYAGWDPGAVPVKFDEKTYIVRFARDAHIAVQDVPKAASTATAAVLRLLPPAQLTKALDQLPADVRAVLRP
ncbi:DUF2267 domain-containing protein [Mycobacterium sp. smrl_JER01]|uniref:DUF2267 domain-containing protein n=1 Tax=Mycobacterium sp. smrl_JER01 TaxID=3402633 RepID=UPI003AD573DE